MHGHTDVENSLFFPYVDMPTLFKSLFYVITLITKVFLSLRPAPCRHVHFISLSVRNARKSYQKSLKSSKSSSSKLGSYPFSLTKT